MRKYEFMTVFPVEENLFKPGMETLKSILNDFDVKISSEEPFGDRDLAYEIKKKKKGKYTLFLIEADPLKMLELDRKLKLVTQMLTYLFIRLDE